MYVGTHMHSHTKWYKKRSIWYILIIEIVNENDIFQASWEAEL